MVLRCTAQSQLISSHELGHILNEEMTEKEKEDLEVAEMVCRRFLVWDLKADENRINEGDVKTKLAVVLGRPGEV